MRPDVPSDLWRPLDAVTWYRDDPTGSVRGYFLRDGFPTSRLPRDADRFRGVLFWWRIDGAEERWRPAGDEIERASQHVGWHVCAVELSVTDHDMGPCPECARIEKRAEAFR